MKTQVEFKSSKFPVEPGEEEQINPGLWGRKLAVYLVEQLNRREICTGEIFSEDWGWTIPIPQGQPSASVWIGCGHQYDGDETFLCFIEAKQSWPMRWFSPINLELEKRRLVEALEAVLKSDGDIREIEWTDA